MMQQGQAERAQRDLLDVEGRIRAAEERQAQLKLQLSKINPSLSTTAGNWHTDLADVAGTAGRRADEVHAGPPGREAAATADRGAVGPGRRAARLGGRVVADNPEYLSVQSQLNSTQREIGALQANAARVRGQIYQYESGSAAAPGVERDYAELTRHRDLLGRQILDIQGKLREADIARSLESEQKGDKFSLIRPPGVASTPFSPNRLGIMLLGMVLGGGLAVGLAALAESSDPSVRSVQRPEGDHADPDHRLRAGDAEPRRAPQKSVWWASYASVLVIATALVAVTVVTS